MRICRFRKVYHGTEAARRVHQKQLPEALQIPLHRPRAFREKKEKQKLVSLDPLELNEEAEEIALLFRV